MKQTNDRKTQKQPLNETQILKPDGATIRSKIEKYSKAFKDFTKESKEKKNCSLKEMAWTKQSNIKNACLIIGTVRK